MKIFNCLIADDEQYALNILEHYISKVDHLHLVAKCADSFEVYNLLQKQPVDVAFLDIEMPQLSGLDLSKSLANPPKIIFTTAYKDYAVTAFELNAVDYLLKPFSFERFLKSIDRLGQAEPGLQKPPAGPQFMDVTVDRKKIRIPIGDILFIEGLGNYLKIHTNGKVYVIHQTFKNIMEQLPKTEFRQVHKSYIIPLSKIKSYTASHVIIAGAEIPIGRSFRDALSS